MRVPSPYSLRSVLGFGSIVLLSLGTSLLAQERPSPAHITSGTYRFLIGETPVGTERFEKTESGWKTAGQFDIFGQRKGTLQASLERNEEGALVYRRKGESGESTHEVEAVLDGRKVRIGEADSEIEGTDPIVFYEDLVWMAFIGVGENLVPLAKAGKLENGFRLTAALPIPGVNFPIEVTESSRGRFEHEGYPIDLWRISILLAGRIDVDLVYSAFGVPLRLDIPSQQVHVVLQGWEEIPSTQSGPTSIVDSGTWRKQLSQPVHEIVHDEIVWSRMRDGVRLAADLYRPVTDEPIPAILVRTPYGRKGEGLLKGSIFARRGYAVLVQDVRGRFESEGEWFPIRNETSDGSDTIDWLAAQPWCDGNVGMIGASYGGWVQWYAARSGNPHLKAIVPQVAPPDPDQNFPSEGGVFLLSSAWWGTVLDGVVRGESLPQRDWTEALSTLPLTDIDEALGIEHPFLDEWLAHPPTDSAYWDPLRYQTYYDRIDVAVLNLTGWFDGDQPGALQNFRGMRAHARSEAVRRSQFLVVGPWGHAFNTNRRIGGVDFGPEAVVDLDSVYIRFFDRYLKGVENGIEEEDPVKVFVTGSNRWSPETDWPLSGTRFTPLYLASPGTAQTVEGGGELSPTPPAEGLDQPDAYRYDPTDLPETLADFNDMSGESATADHSELPDRDDFLDYTSPPLAAPVELSGPFEAVLSVSTDGPDTDFCVALYRIAPDGRMTGIAGGIQRLRYRFGSRRDAPVEPGEIVEVTVDLWAHSIRLEAGDRLRLQVGSSFFPGYARNLNTLDPIATATEPRVAINRVHHDTVHSSRIILPIVPRVDAPRLEFVPEKG